MGRYIALWHIGDATRGEVIEIGDREAKRLLALKAIQPVGESEPARRKMPEAVTDEAETEPEAETAEETETEEAEEETEDRLEIDPLADISEAKPEAPKKTRKSRKGA